MTRSLHPWPVPPPRVAVVDVRALPRPAVPAAPATAVPAPRAPVPAAPAVGAAPGSTVLVTGSGGPAGVAVVRRLVALGHRVVAVDIDPIAAGSALAAVGGVVPRADDPAFVDALLAFAAEHGADALVSTVAEELPALTAAADRLTAAGLATWLPELAAVDLCCDKAAFAVRLVEAGVPTPATAATVEAAADVPGPWIVKPNAGRGSRGVQLLDTAADVAAAMTADPGLIVQTRLAGREFTADALVARDGSLLTVVPRWRDATKAGISVQGTTFESEAVTTVVADALSAVGLTGPANVQGFVAEDGTVTVVEINPRFSGGLPLTLAAGADVVGTYLAGVREPAAELPYLFFTAGVRMSRYFAETYTSPDGSPVTDPCAVPAVTR
ncbi:ATP-grasp domain-containing protein [Modestobacter muralis]|uniref:ATP-grasp domain-containing protein n=1 Tax=Modestobacter muralis TaxID=1608614 RepID=A0A6P0ERB8_9ACTN|nr:ATP-grasp domain-containing protein [Modestobacter muralis]NEK93346.1 ATP-grasp domain-containing protein [Modestobacter muralis]NEN50113.1 ATP-grasp domain-containing protein [Modestobacter muralis]